MKLLPIILFSLLLICSETLHATNYYINSLDGNNQNSGTSKILCWKSIEPIKNIQLQKGDSILFAKGQQFTGMVSIVNVNGSATKPIVISSYDYKSSNLKPILDAGNELYTILIQNASFVKVIGVEVTALTPYQSNNTNNKNEIRCGILVQVTKNEPYESIELIDVVVHDIFYYAPGFTRSAAEIKSANGTQNYGWGIRFINNTKSGKLTNIKVLQSEIYKVSHTGLKFTATTDGIQQIEVANCKITHTGGPGMQFSGVTNGYIHHNQIQYSGSTADSRNWSRGSGLWTWGCSNILIEHNRFENANGPGDSAGVHIDFNCNDVIVQYNLSANNAGGFCEILGNNYNCAYRYNISINDGFRVKGVNGAFQEGKIFWLSGYQGNEKKNAGPYNSYFYNNTIYVAAGITPRVAISSSSKGVYIANNIFYFEDSAKMVAGDQKKVEVDADGIPNVVFKNNLFLNANNWPLEAPVKDESPKIGNPFYTNKGGVALTDYRPTNKKLIKNKGIHIKPIPTDTIGIRIGLKMHKDILGNTIKGKPDMGAIELK
jgi:hypothetical protein